MLPISQDPLIVMPKGQGDPHAELGGSPSCLDPTLVIWVCRRALKKVNLRSTRHKKISVKEEAHRSFGGLLFLSQVLCDSRWPQENYLGVNKRLLIFGVACFNSTSARTVFLGKSKQPYDFTKPLTSQTMTCISPEYLSKLQ